MARISEIIRHFTPTERRWFFTAAALLFVGLAGWFLFSYYAGTTEAPVAGGVYHEGIVGQPVTMNPLLGNASDVDRDLQELLFASLGELGSSTPSTDGLTWTMKLTDGLLWSDGEPLNADDVVFTLESIAALENASPLYATWQGVSILRINDREVRFTVKTPYVFFPRNLARLKIIPRHIFGAIPPANFKLSAYNLEPVGSGPYTFSSLRKRRDGFIDEYILRANPHSAAGAPLIHEFRVRLFETATAALRAFTLRDIDGLGGISPEAASTLGGTYQQILFPVPRYYAVFFNPTTSTPLKEKAVRMALTDAIDRRTVIAAAFPDAETTAAASVAGPLLPFIEGYESGLYASSSPRIADIIRSLEESGWKLGLDGIRQKTVGKSTLRLSFALTVPDTPFLLKAAEAIKTQWEAVGIDATIMAIAPDEIVSAAVKPRNYQMILFGNILNNTPDVYSFWHSSERYYPGLNLALYSNKETDALLESVRREPDMVKRLAALSRFQTIIRDEAPAVFLFTPQYAYIAQKNLGGVEPVPLITPSDRFAHVAQWHLKTARVFK